MQDREFGPDLRMLGRILSERRRLILATVALCTGFTAFYVSFATPIYTADVVLLIEPEPEEQLEAARSVELSPTEARDYYMTQYDILRSRSLAHAVFEGEQIEPSRFRTRSDQLEEWLATQPGRTLGALVGWLPGEAKAAQDPADGADFLDDYVEDWLEVEPYPESRLVRVSFSSPDAELSARIANAHARAYILRSLELRRQALDESRRSLSLHLDRLAARVEQSERELNAYRREHGILSLDAKENVLVDQLGALNQKLAEAEAERIARGSIATVGSQRDPHTVPAVVASPLVTGLKQELALLEADYALRTANMKRSHPLWPRDLQAKMSRLRGRLQSEIDSLLESAHSAYEEAREHEAVLRARLAEQRDQVLALKDEAVEYAVREREVEANRQLYEQVRQRMLALGVASDVQASSVVVIDEAFPPDGPSQPRKALGLTLAMMVGLTLGSGLAFGREYLDNTVRTPEELERYLGIPALGLVPDFASLSRRGRPRLPSRTRRMLAAIVGPRWNPLNRVLAVSRDPFSTASEAYRAIRTGVLLTQPADPSRVILFTSSVHGEGKTTTALNTAALFAQLGEPVLVIDADLRRSSCQRVLGLPAGPGLSEALTGGHPQLHKLEIQDVTIDFLPSGMPASKPTEILGSERMKQILTHLRQRYAYVLIDAPPLIPVSDSVVLSTLVDGVILVVDPRRAPRPVVFKAHRRLERARARVLGTVVNRVRARVDHDPYDTIYDDDSRIPA